MKNIKSIVILIFTALMLVACAILSTNMIKPQFSLETSFATPAPINIKLPDLSNIFVQATVDYGQGQLSYLSRRATEVSLDLSQAANAAALSAQEDNQRQKMELDYQATVVSQNIAQAVATQQILLQQTETARGVTVVAQNRAATAAQSVYQMEVTQTVQAQVVLDTQILQTSQAVASMTSYPLTATPFAVLQAARLMQQYDREQQTFVDRIVTPLLPVFGFLVLLLSALVVIVAFWRFIPLQWPLQLRSGHVKVIPRPITIIDGVIADPGRPFRRVIPSVLTPVNPPGMSADYKIHVEIIDASELPVAQWVAEVERQLANGGGLET